jgi:hypothetical protein
MTAREVVFFALEYAEPECLHQTGRTFADRQIVRGEIVGTKIYTGVGYVKLTDTTEHRPKPAKPGPDSQQVRMFL